MIYVVSDFDDGNTMRLSCDHFSRASVETVIHNIRDIGYECQFFGGIQELSLAYAQKATFEKSVLFFNMSDGLYQSSRRMQAPILLDLLGVKYTGSSPFAVGLMNNKFFSKLAAEKCGVLIPQGELIHSHLMSETELLKSLKMPYPSIVKPNGEGSSVGIDCNSIVFTIEEAITQIRKLSTFYDDIIIERFIPGADASTLIVGNKYDIRMVETIIYKTNNSFILENSVRDTYIKENWISEGYIISSVPEYRHLSSEFKRISETIFNYIGCNDIARIDYRISKSGEIYFLEINSMPTITPTSDIGMIYNRLNIPYHHFLKEYIETAYLKYYN